MKKIGIIFALLAMLFVTSCNDDNETTHVLNITVNYPDNYKSNLAKNAMVYISREGSSRTDSILTNENGQAIFNSLTPGNYKVNVKKTLSATDAEEETGVSKEITLTATANNISVIANTNQTISLKGTILGGLVFKEVYYTGSKTPEGKHYFSDQYYEIYNNSTEVIYADGLCLGVVDGWYYTPKVLAWLSKYPDQQAIASFWYVPGSGTEHPIEPGKSIIIAQDGINHKTDALGNPNSPVDLSIADWEVFVPRDDNRDIDAPEVPNMLLGHANWFGFDWLTSVFGSGYVIFRVNGDVATYVKENGVPKPNARKWEADHRFILVKNSDIIDAFQTYNDNSETSMPKLHPVVDAGFTFDPNGTYTSKCVRRKVKSTINGRVIYQDTNNSTNDFLNNQECQPKQYNTNN